MSDFTKEQEKKYIEEKAIKCPSCGSSDIKFSDLCYNREMEVYSIGSCLSCGRCWKDIYTLTRISKEV